jgi:GrpB-like predicted nucleotidyltransferase (UPF0157 family)
MLEKSLEDRIAAALREEVSIVSYDPAWPRVFETEAEHLRVRFPRPLINRIEHFGSTAVPGLAAKPVIDMLIEVNSLDETKKIIVPLLEAEGYDYFWRPTCGDDVPPFYAWFIKRDSAGVRTHHIHMVERHFEHWERLLFRDYLIGHPNTAKDYETLKLGLAAAFPHDREAYTSGKTEFVVRVMEVAKEYFRRG